MVVRWLSQTWRIRGWRLLAHATSRTFGVCVRLQTHCQHGSVCKITMCNSKASWPWHDQSRVPCQHQSQILYDILSDLHALYTESHTQVLACITSSSYLLTERHQLLSEKCVHSFNSTCGGEGPAGACSMTPNTAGHTWVYRYHPNSPELQFEFVYVGPTRLCTQSKMQEPNKNLARHGSKQHWEAWLVSSLCARSIFNRLHALSITGVHRNQYSSPVGGCTMYDSGLDLNLPHMPWFFTGVTAEWFLQSILLGRADNSTYKHTQAQTHGNCIVLLVHHPRKHTRATCSILQEFLV